MSKPSRRPIRQARKAKPGHRLNRQERIDLNNKRKDNLVILREEKKATDSMIEPRIAASNCKSSATTIIEQQHLYEDIVQAQLAVWRPMLPQLMKNFSRVKDPRRPQSVKHSKIVLLVFGLLLFVFRMPSKREFNAQLTGPGLFEFFKKLFPEIDSVPHADTITRLLKEMDINDIERSQVAMIRWLIKNKKLKKLLIQGRFPISIDGTQKMTRDDQLQVEGWQLRTIHKKHGKEYQQYVYVLEANITFANGLNIPLLTEYCYLDVKDYEDEKTKQDCELNAFHRLTDKIKKYFPKLKIIMLLDSLYACESVIDCLRKKRWDFMIKLPAKLKTLNRLLDDNQSTPVSIAGQPFYRERKQAFNWLNDVDYKGHKIHLVRCYETWQEVSRTTGNKETKKSEHTWISSRPLNIDNIHVRCNLAARKRAFIEDNFNTEKNRGYQYQHAFCYQWNAMKGFHYLMRLAHTLNAISEFGKKLKKYVRSLGVSKTMRNIFEAIKHAWISNEFLDQELKKEPQLKLDFSP